MGITFSYKVLQIYLRRLRLDDRLKNRRLQPAAKSPLRELKVLPAAGRRTTKPIAFVIPGSRKPVWTGSDMFDMPPGHAVVPVQQSEWCLLIQRSFSNGLFKTGVNPNESASSAEIAKFAS
jgi:hypothetical protein